MSPPATILVVDDDPAARKYAKMVLSHEGYEVVIAESGEAALEHIASQEFDLALVDLKMAGVDGMDVLETLQDQSPDTVAILITAHPSLETVFDALHLQAHDYLFKPCKPADLRKSVRYGLLRRQESLQQQEELVQQEDNPPPQE